MLNLLQTVGLQHFTLSEPGLYKPLLIGSKMYSCIDEEKSI